MTVLFKTTMYWGRSPKGMAKAFKQARPKALLAVGKTWNDEMLPVHFEERASSLYGYHKRDPKYEERKLRKFGHKKPLVWTGTMQRVLSQASKVQATSKRVVVTLAQTAPAWLKGYISFRGKRNTGPDKWLEVKAINSGDTKKLAQVAANILREAMANARGNPADMGVDL